MTVVVPNKLYSKVITQLLNRGAKVFEITNANSATVTITTSISPQNIAEFNKDMVKMKLASIEVLV